MKPSAKNSGVIYTGRVGAKLKPPSAKPKQGTATKGHPVELKGGPLAGEFVTLTHGSHTLDLAPMKGWGAGRYVGREWVTAESQSPLKEAA
jgi:hypothetical protein